MKRNLSSQAIRAMAIGMAVTLGSATAISGVVTGTVVNVYAASFPGFTATVAKESTNDLKITIGRESTNVFSLTGGQKLTNLEVKNGQKVVFSTESGGNGQINNITVSEKGNHEELYITIPSTEIKDGSLEGTEAKLTITKLKGSEIKYGQSSSEKPLDFEGELNVTASGGTIGIDKTGPTLKSENIAYDDNNKTITIEASENLENFSEQANSGKFEFKSKPDANESNLEITNYSVVGNKLVLKLNKSLIDGEYIINYKVQDASNLKDAANNALKTGEVKFKLAETQKLVDSAKLSSDKSKITITFKSNVKNLVGTTENNKDEFKITGNSVSSVTVKDVAVQNTKELVLTLQGDLSNASNIKVGYTAKTNNKAVKVDNKVLLLENLEVTSDGQVSIAPIIQKGVIENNARNKIVLYFDSPVKVKDNNNKPRKDDFGFKINSSLENIIKDVEISTVANSIVTLNLTKDIKKDDNIELKYKNTSGNHIVSEDGLKQVQDSVDNIKIENNIKDEVPPVESNITATTSAGTYTFKELTNTTVALTKFDVASSRQASDNKFENGVLTANGKVYTLTEIGVGTKVEGLTDTSLKGHTSNVTTIKENAFNGNTDVTTLAFPKVTTVGENAFKGANALTTIDLGSQANKTTVADNAFTDAKAIITVTTNAASKAEVTTVAKKGNPSVKVEVSISEDKYNAKDAKIEKGKFYQTKDGLLFKGLETKNSLTFMGKKEFTSPTTEYGLDGSTEAKAYFVTYVEGKVTLQSEKGEGVQPPLEETTFTAEIGGKTGTFEKIKNKNEVALIKVDDKVRVARATTSGTLKDGELTVGAEKYNLTQLGNGTESLGNFESSVLEGNLGKVATVKAKAFDGNTTIITITLPAITTIEANAFTGTNKLTTIDLGNNDVTIAKDAFKDAGNSLTIKTNSDKTKNNITNSGSNATVENPAPEVVSGEVTKENADFILTLTLSEKVFATQKPDFTDFVVKSGTNSGALQNNTVKSISIANNSSSATNTVKLTLTNAVNKGDTVTVAYTQTRTEDKKIKDTASKEVKALASFADSKITVVNNVEDSPVQTTTVNITEAKVNKNTVTLTTKESNLDNATINKGSEANVKGFVFKKGGSNQVNITGVVVANNNTITLTLESPISESDSNLTFEYTGGSDDFKVGGKKIDNIASKEVINETNDAPTIVSGTYTKGNPGVIKLTASEDLGILDISSDFGFVIKSSDNQTTYTITNVKVENSDKKLITIKVNEDLTSVNDTLKVTYTKPADSNQIKDAKGLALENITQAQDVTAATRGIAQRDDDFAVIALAADKVEVVNGDVTGITSVKGATATEINSILTDKLIKIDSGAFNGSEKDLTLNFKKVDISKLNIESGAFSGAKGLNITGVNSSDTEKLAKMIGSNSDIKINGKTTQDIIKDNSNSGNGGSGSGGGSSSGGSGGGSGANIGTITNKKPNTEETTSQGNKNETVVENKQLSFDVIKLPSVEGEAKVFGDVSANHWAKSYIDKLSTARIINGSNGMFNPNGQTKRADVTIMLVNLLGLTPEANNKFADVNASAYYAPYVGTASTYGIVNGSNGMFNPQGVISRQDTMVMIAQILKGLNLNVNADTTALSQFGDASKVSAYANESVAILVNSGIISGNNGKLNPTAPVTRAEMATIMSKLYDVLASANK